uniref:Uncharacterized protein n=1 Tax=Arundo donax TaxID=35708 RepID=A0A0A9AM04_ARUDO
MFLVSIIATLSKDILLLVFLYILL